jgi:hypothetical protein
VQATPYALHLVTVPAEIVGAIVDAIVDARWYDGAVIAPINEPMKSYPNRGVRASAFWGWCR